ncbi:MAG: peptide-methionine (S)-S-oxide reductase MsrA [Vulcanimicrobiaceae bacterium]
MTAPTTTSTATFAAGCFWGVEAAFRQLPGVLEAVAGYTGGTLEQPSYRQVCSGTTGHAEAVELRFDPHVVSYEQLLDAFWQIHDPTQRNRQGPDVGTQYRSAIFVHDGEQDAAARSSLARAQPRFSQPIATEIVKASAFWPAEEYHQRYFEKHGGACHIGNLDAAR